MGLAKIKYPEIEGCLNYLILRSNWIDHWVKAIQSGLVNTLARGMAQSYTDLAAQHAVTGFETFTTLTPPLVPQEAPRFTSRGIAHSTSEAFPPYIQPEMTFIEEVYPTGIMGIVDADASVSSPAIPSNSSRLQGNGGLSGLCRRNLPITPPRKPTRRIPSEQSKKQTREYESTHGHLTTTADSATINVVRIRDESKCDEYGQHATSDENRSKPTSEIPEIGDIVEIYLRHTKRGRRGRPVTKRGRVTETKPCDPTRVKTDTCPGKFRKVFENY